MKKSFFGEYFLYKLSGLRGILVASSVLSVGGFPILVTLLKIIAFLLEKENANPGSIGDEASVIVWGAGIYSMMCLPFVLPALIVLAAVTPVITFKFYNKRVCTDTIGSLPLTYNQRFFGDFLSGFAATVAPFLVCTPYVLIMAKSAASHEIEELEQFFGIFAHNILIYAVILASAYTFSTLVVSCCGKVGSSVFYSLFGMLLVPGVAAFYTGFVSENAVGLSAVDGSLEAVRMIPPLGLCYDFFSFWFSFVNTLFSDTDLFHTYSPMTYAVMIILTVAYGVGAYFIGKYRRTERIGRDFVYEGAYLVMLIMMTAAIPGGAFLTASDFKNPAPWLIGSAVIALILFAALELSHTKNPKKLPKALLKYAGICAVCFGFFALVKATDSFGLADVVPGANEISRIEIKGEYLYSYNDAAIVYDDKDAVAEIISEHKKLLSDKSKIYTGDDIIISYKLKNGFEINRRYSSVQDRDEVKKMSEVIAKLPTSSSNIYGVLNSTDYSDLTFEIDCWESEMGLDSETESVEGDIPTHEKRINFLIKKSKTEEFRQILLNDIKEHYSSDLNGAGGVGQVTAIYTRNGVKRYESFWILEPYTASRKFISDPDNRETDPIGSEEQSKTYTAILYFNRMEKNDEYLSVEISPESALGKELASMMIMSGSEDASEKIEIRDDSWLSYSVKKSDEKRASEIIMQIAREALDNND